MARRFETRKVDVGGVETAVQVAGQGPAVLFLHGASTLEGADYLLPLAERFTLYAPFHPGFGDSADAPALAGMGDLVAHTRALIAALGLTRPHVIGFSMGGWMAVELVAADPQAFGRVVLVAPAGLNDAANPMTDLGAIAPQDLPGYLSHDPAVAGGYFPDGSDPAAAQAFGAARAREGESLGRILAPHGFGHPDLGAMAGRIRNPTLVVWGEADRMMPARTLDTWLGALPAATPLRVPEAGHFALMEKPDTVARIGDFLAG